jgi:hypothetical protein
VENTGKHNKDFFFKSFETEPHYVAQVGLELVILPHLSLSNTGITDVSHHKRI